MNYHFFLLKKKQFNNITHTNI